MKASELNSNTIEELQAKERELAQEFFNLKFQHHTGRLENSAKLSMIKKDIARVKTVIRAKRA
jgi:large subunit ribosomal protein L29